MVLSYEELYRLYYPDLDKYHFFENGLGEWSDWGGSLALHPRMGVTVLGRFGSRKAQLPALITSHFTSGLASGLEQIAGGSPLSWSKFGRRPNCGGRKIVSPPIHFFQEKQ